MKRVPQVLNSENLVGKEAITATEIAKYLDNFREMLGDAEKVLKSKAKTKYYY